MKKGSGILQKAGIGEPVLESEIILSRLLGLERFRLYLEPLEIPGRTVREYFEIIRKRALRIPLAYLTGRTYFWNHEFDIRPGVFIPRPETELLIESAKEKFNRKTIFDILDVGTGCGNIAISLAFEFPACTVTATDISRKSLKLAKKNAFKLGVENKIKFFLCDLFPARKQLWDLIVSNPPYITGKEMEQLQPEVRKEPKRALYGGKYGLRFYKKILKYAPLRLKNDGFLLMEISPSVKDFFLRNDFQDFRLIEMKKDLCGLERMVLLQKKGL